MILCHRSCISEWQFNWTSLFCNATGRNRCSDQTCFKKISLILLMFSLFSNKITLLNSTAVSLIRKNMSNFPYYNYPNRWIGRGSLLEWPPCSLYMGLMTFFLGELDYDNLIDAIQFHLKNQAVNYGRKPYLRQSFRASFKLNWVCLKFFTFLWN